MDFENFNQIQEQQKQNQTDTVTENKTDTGFEDLPRLEDLLKSESEVTTIQAPELKGLKQVEQGKRTAEKTFARKEDEKRTFVRRRVKILTGVYACVFALLLGFVGVNTASIITKGHTNTTATQNIEIATANLNGVSTTPQGEAVNGLELTVNTPRDYGDDDTELTFFDRLTIVFRSLFGQFYKYQEEYG